MTFGSRAHPARHTLVAAILACGMACGVAIARSAPPPQSATGGKGAAPQGVQDGVNRPSAAKRLVRVFDFEEPDNPHPVPDHWFHAQDNPDGERRPGFPRFNLGVFDTTLAVSGAASVRLPTQGGSTCLRLEPGEVPVFPEADYTVAAKVRTEGLDHARAFLTARLLDQHLKPIPGSEVRSEPELSPAQWRSVSVLMSGKWKQAAWLQIDLELLQPRQFEPPPPEGVAQHAVQHEDVAGAAFFDDVAVSLVPHTRFWAESPSGVFLASETPTLNMQARDQGGENLPARVAVLDIDGRVVDQARFELDPSARTTTWTPKLPGYGWFRAILDIAAPGATGTRSEVRFVHLPPAERRASAAARDAELARFGVIAETLPERLLEQVPPLVERAGGRFIVLPAFDAATPLEQTRSALAARTSVIERLLARGQEITLAVTSVPAGLARQETLDPGDAVSMAELDPRSWSPYLDPTLDVFGQRILRYQLGATEDQHALRHDPTAALARFRETVGHLVPEPRVLLPWRADHPVPAVAMPEGKRRATIAGASIVFPRGFAPEAMADVAQAWQPAVDAGVEVTVVPELPGVDQFGARARSVEAARRIIEFWTAFGSTAPSTRAARLAIESPWRISGPSEEERLLPEPELSVLAHLSSRLATRRFVSSIPAPTGVRALLMAEHVAGADGASGTLGHACVIAWSVSAPADRAWVDVYPTADAVDLIDMFGNATQLPASGTGDAHAGTQLRVPLTDAPVIIEGVDAYLAQFTSSLRLSPTFIPAVVIEHEHTIQLTNPWPVRITGQIQLKEAETLAAPTPARPRAGAWTMSPNIIEFAAAPGQTISLPLTISFGPGQIAGSKDLVILARVLADRPYATIRATATVDVGLPDLDVLPEAQLTPTPAGPDVTITAAVINKDRRARTLRLELAASDTPSQQLDLSDLPPGQTVFKRFVIRGGARPLAGKHVRITLSDDESAARLSKIVLVPEAR